MRAEIPGRSARTSRSVIRHTGRAILAVSIAVSASGWSQTTPNWGSGSAAPGTSGGGSTSAWGGARMLTPETPQTPNILHSRSDRASVKSPTVPPALASVLQRPDTDTVTLPSGERATVREIRAEANSRQAIITALKTGSVPAGHKRVLLGTARAQKYQELLNASTSAKDTARREAAAQWTSPSVVPDSPNEQRDRPNAWGSSPGAESHRTYSTVGRLPGSQTTPVLHSGIGTSSLSNSRYASERSTNTGEAFVSQKPDQAYIAQTLPSGIGAVNGHSNPQLTPGGVYTITGKGFGDAVGAVDLIGAHLPSGRVSLPVTQWQDGKVQVQFPEPVSGVPDGIVTLRLTTHAGALLTRPVQFYATRQQLMLSGTDLDLNQLFDISLGNQKDWSETRTTGDQVLRTKSGNDINCPSVGQDSLRTRFPAGWALVEVSLSTWLPTQGNSSKDFYGNDGDTVVSGNYAITQVPAGFTNQLFNASWGVLRSHSSSGFRLVPQFSGNDFGWSGNDGCVSAYTLSVTMVGPAGLRPY